MNLKTILPNLHALEFPISQAYIWERPEGLTIIDTCIAGSESEILDAVAALGHRPEDVTEVVLTHFHADHCGSAAAIASATQATVIAHRVDAPAIAGLEHGRPPVLTVEERPLAESILPRVPPAPTIAVDRLVDEGDTLRGGAVVLSVPGHTPGSMALLLPQLGVLLTGDTIASFNNRVILGPFNVDREQAVQSVRKLADLEFQVACFGHGAPLVDEADQQIRQLAFRLAG